MILYQDYLKKKLTGCVAPMVSLIDLVVTLLTGAKLGKRPLSFSLVLYFKSLIHF